MSDPNASVNSAVAVVLDPRNGEILAMVSLPAYDNQVFIDNRDRQQIKTYLSDDVTKPMLNKALYETYAPGSTLKPFMAAAGLQEGTLKTDTTYNCPGSIWVPYSLDENQRDEKPCWVKKRMASRRTARRTVIDGIANSCDIFFYNVGAPHQIDPTTDKYLHFYEYLPTGPVEARLPGARYRPDGQVLRGLRLRGEDRHDRSRRRRDRHRAHAGIQDEI